jgi:DNA gyrase subunit A
LLLQANTQDILYLFGAHGQAVSLPVYKLPQAQEIGYGTHWAVLTGFTRRQFVSCALVIPATAKGFLILGTIGGMIKRIRLEELPGITGSPFPVMNVADDDSLGWANLTTGEDEIVLVTASGQAIRFKESSVRPMGLLAGGIKGIKLAGDADDVVAMDLAREDAYLWSITDNGLAKASPMAVYPIQGRYGQGVINVRFPKGADEVVASVIGDDNTKIIITMANGSTKSVKLGKTIKGNRPIMPRRLITLGKRNRITGAVVMRTRQED